MTRRSNFILAAVLLVGPAVVGVTKACAQEANPGFTVNVGQNRPVLDQNVKDRLCALNDPTGRRCRSSQTAPQQPGTSQRVGNGAQPRQPPSRNQSGGTRPSRRG